MSDGHTQLQFHPVDSASMEFILPYLRLHKERSCDFSYGGLLMWVDMFRYEYAIHSGTLFIKGLTPADGDHTETRVAFSLPLGMMPLRQSVALLRQWCETRNIPLVFSSVPQQGAEQLMAHGAKEIRELESWEDYIYDAGALSSLAGKKLSKKRNHVNRFKTLYPDWEFSFMTPSDIGPIREFMLRIVDIEASQSEEARTERQLADRLLEEIAVGNKHLLGGVLRVGGNIAAYTIGDIMADTLFIHVEKAERAIEGSFEMINQCFARAVTETHRGILFINREDDAGNPGLRLAKQSYHPVYLLKKFNVFF